VVGIDASVGNRSRFHVGDEVCCCGAVERPGGNAKYHRVNERLVGDKSASLSSASTWCSGDSPPMLIAGGSGVVPLCCMPRHRLRTGSDVPAQLLYSSRTLPDVIYRGELGHYRGGVQLICTLTRTQPPGWTGYSGRVNTATLAEIVWPASQHPLAFICGPTAFVEAVAENLIGLGYPPERIKAERFGGT